MFYGKVQQMAAEWEVKFCLLREATGRFRKWLETFAFFCLIELKGICWKSLPFHHRNPLDRLAATCYVPLENCPGRILSLFIVLWIFKKRSKKRATESLNCNWILFTIAAASWLIELQSRLNRNSIPGEGERNLAVLNSKVPLKVLQSCFHLLRWSCFKVTSAVVKIPPTTHFSVWYASPSNGVMQMNS